jgi:dUTPase
MDIQIEILDENKTKEELLQYFSPEELENNLNLPLRIKSLKSLYNGTRLVLLEKIKKNLKDGFFFLGANERALIGTGIKIYIPENFEGQIRPIDEILLKKGITILNTPGNIDETYEDEIDIIIYNTNSYPIKIFFEDIIAKIIICPIAKFKNLIVITKE